MKNILFVLHDDYTKSGATASMLTIIKNIYTNGNMNISVLIPNRGGDVEKYLKDLGIDVEKINYYGSRVYLTDKPIINLFEIFKSILKNIINILIALIFCIKCKKKYDLIYTNTSDIYFGAIISLIMRVQHVWHMREFGLEDQNANHVFGEKMFYFFAEKISDHIIVISKALNNKLKKYLENSNKLQVVYNDIDPININYNANSDYYKEKMEILIAGTVVENKGQEKVIEILAELKTKGVFINLNIAGSGSKSYLDKIKNKIKKLNLENDVFLLGHIHDLRETRKKMHLSIVSSVSEAFGRVTIESMLSGLVVLAYNRGANPELIENGFNGFLYNEYSELSQILEMIYFNREILKEIKGNALQYSSKFTINSSSEEIEKIILRM